MTLKGLGRLAGLSHPFLSQVERGLARPSVSSVGRIAAALDVPVAQLWAPARRSQDVRLVRRDEGATAMLQGQLLRDLVADPAALSVREWSGGTRQWPAELNVMPGALLVYAARGGIDVDLDGVVYELAEGDALVFDGEVPHRFRRRGGPSTRALVVTSGA